MTTQSAPTKAQANAEVMRQSLDAFLSGDMPKFTSLLAADIVWAIPGNSPLAGEHRGVEGVTAFLGKVMQVTNGTLRPSVSNIVTDDEGGAFVTRDTAERSDGKKLDALLVLHVTIRDVKWASVREYIHDLYAWDAFWAD